MYKQQIPACAGMTCLRGKDLPATSANIHDREVNSGRFQDRARSPHSTRVELDQLPLSNVIVVTGRTAIASRLAGMAFRTVRFRHVREVAFEDDRRWPQLIADKL